MTEWSLPQLLSGLHQEIQGKLELARKSFGHSTTKGDASEAVWLELLSTYLPTRYRAAKAHVVDSNGQFSQQIDVVVFDRQYSPFIFQFQNQTVIPAESVYAVFEAKQTLNSGIIDYAQKKVATVRQLYRTTLPIPYAGGTYPAKTLTPIIGGVLTFDSDWTPAMGDRLDKALRIADANKHLDMGCIAAHGHFNFDADSGSYKYFPEGKPATAFLLNLISQLQFTGTVPMIDIKAYARWLVE